MAEGGVLASVVSHKQLELFFPLFSSARQSNAAPFLAFYACFSVDFSELPILII
jgi:hypothetical protein